MLITLTLKQQIYEMLKATCMKTIIELIKATCIMKDIFFVVKMWCDNLRVASYEFKIFMWVASYFLRVEKKNYKLPIYFTSCELLFKC